MARKQTKNINFDEVPIGPDIPIYPSSVVCALIGIPIWTLKQLDTEKIVCPPRETELSSRLYTKRELKKVEQCWFYMNEHQVKVPGLKVILSMEDGTFR